MPTAATVNAAQPGRLDPVFGRRQELARLGALCARHRVVVVKGVGGIGKTTLLSQFGRHRRVQPDTPVWLVDLAQARGHDGLLIAIAAALGLGGRESNTADDHADLLAHGLAAYASPVVMLDNAEHLSESLARWLPRLVERVEQATWIIGSRCSVEVDGAVELEMPPLDQAAAVELFADRAYAVGSPGGHSEQVLEACIALVDALDRIPLAITLVAARSRVRTPAQLLDQLPDLLGHTPTDVATQVVRWAWEQLGEDARRVMIQCAVFAGRFGTEMVSRALGADAQANLVALMGYSLLQSHSTGDGEDEVSVFKVVGDFVRSHASEDQLQQARRRHAGVYAELAADLHEASRGADEVEAGQRYQRASANLRAALDFALDHQPRQGAEFALDLCPYFHHREPELRVDQILGRALQCARQCGDVRLEALLLLERVVCARRSFHDVDAMLDDTNRSLGLMPALPEDERAGARARAWRLLAVVHEHLGDVERARHAIDQGLRHAAAAQDLFEQTALWCLRLALEANLGRLEIAEQAASQAAALVEQVERPSIHYLVLSRQAYLAGLRHDYERAVEFDRRALAVAEELGTPRRVLATLLGLVDALILSGRLEDARAHLDELLSRARRQHFQVFMAHALHSLSEIELLCGEYPRAFERAEEARDIYQQTGSRQYAGVAWVFAALASAAGAGFPPRQPRATVAHARNYLQRVEAELDDDVRQMMQPWLDLASLLVRAADGEVTSAQVAQALDALVEDAPQTRVVMGAELVGRKWLQVTEAVEDLPLLVGPAARWFEPPDGQRVDISRRHSARLILDALVEARLRAPGERLDVDALAAAGWPEDRIDAKQAANRVYVVVAFLRKHGLRDLLVRDSHGYALDAEVAVERAANTLGEASS